MEFGMPTLVEFDALDGSVELCRELGLKFVEINMNLPMFQASALAKNPPPAREGVYFTLHLDEALNPFDFNENVARAYRETAAIAIKTARRAEMPVVNMHMPMGVHFKLPGHKVYLFDRYWNVIRDSVLRFRDACDAASQGDVVICVENTSFGEWTRLGSAIDLLLESDNFALTYDAGHDYCDSLRAKPFYMARINRLYHMHLHGANAQTCHLSLYDGDMDIPALIDMGRNCRIVLETKESSALKRSVNWIAERNLL